MAAVFNSHKVGHQVDKARDFADVLTAVGCDAEGVFELGDVGWALATQIVSAQRGKPVDLPSDATKTLVWHRLQERERLADADPLEGLPR